MSRCESTLAGENIAYCTHTRALWYHASLNALLTVLLAVGPKDLSQFGKQWIPANYY
jgi:hypothetical protein